MNQILRCDWLPEWARWSFLARSGLPAMSRKKNLSESHIINPLLTKLVRSRWLHIGQLFLFLACLWTSTPSRSINTHKKISQYPAILISHLANNSYLLLQYIECLRNCCSVFSRKSRCPQSKSSKQFSYLNSLTKII